MYVCYKNRVREALRDTANHTGPAAGTSRTAVRSFPKQALMLIDPSYSPSLFLSSCEAKTKVQYHGTFGSYYAIHYASLRIITHHYTTCHYTSLRTITPPRGMKILLHNLMIPSKITLHTRPLRTKWNFKEGGGGATATPSILCVMMR